MSATYRIDGIDIDRWGLLLGSTYRAPVSLSRSVTRVPGRHGSISAGLPTFNSPMVTFRVAPEADDNVPALERLVDDLAALSARPSVTMTHVVGDREVQADAVLVSADWDPSSIMWGQHVSGTFVYELPGVFWRDQVTSDLNVPAGTSSVAGAGSAPVADAIVRFAADASFPSLVDVTSGTSIQVERTMAGGRYVFVDVGSLRAWSSASSSAWAGGTDESQYLSYGPAGPLQLWPNVAEVGGVTARGYRVQSSHDAVARVKGAWL